MASVDGKGELATAPGPQTPDGKNPFITMRTRPTDTAGEPKFDFYTLGPDEVYAGHDMYFLVQSILISGPVDNLYVINRGGYNNDTDGVVKSLGPASGNPDTVGVHFSCTWNNASGVDANEQSPDRSRNLGYCNDLNNNIRDMTFRLRTQPNTAPGKYSVTFTLETNGQRKTGKYDFTVLPPATAPPPPQLTTKPIPGLGTWEKQMVELGKKWCAYRDEQNIAGNFVDNWGWTGDAWFYDGGRTFENIDTYTAAAGHPNHPVWQHCAINLLSPYANWQVANNAAMAGYSTFTYGMAMNYLRTHDEVMRKAISMLATVGPQRVGVGNVDPWGIRENSYRSNAWMTDEMLGAPRWPLLQRNIDKIMGNLNIIARGEGGVSASLHGWPGHGDPDPLVRAEHGGRPSRLSRNTGDQRSSRWRLEILLAAERAHVYLQPLPAPTESGSFVYELEQPGFGGLRLVLAADRRQRRTRSWRSALRARLRRSLLDLQRQAVQPQFEFSFDFVRFRKGINNSTVLPENNPYTGPYADTVPPISEKVNCDPNYFRGCKAGSITSTTATIFWGTFKPATTQVIYGKTTSYGQMSPMDKNMTLGALGDAYRLAAKDDVPLPYEVGG